MAYNKHFDNNLLSFDGGSIYKSDEDSILLQAESLRNVLLIPLDNEVYFPYLTVVTLINNPDNIASIKKALKSGEKVFFFLAHESMPENNELIVSEDVIGRYGVLASIIESNENPDGTIEVQTYIEQEGYISSLSRKTPYMRGDVECTPLEKLDHNDDAPKLLQDVNTIYEELVKPLSEADKKQIYDAMASIPNDTMRRISFMMQNSPSSAEERYNLFACRSLETRLALFLTFMHEELEKLKIRMELNSKTLSDMGQRQRDEFLRSQLNVIRNELGESDLADADELRERAADKDWSPEVEKHFYKELRKLQRYNPTSADYAVQYSYLDTLLNLPWNHCDCSEFDLAHVSEVLDEQHYGLDKVKERIIEQMAVMKLRANSKAPILCLYGPPGVGKTSLGKSVAEALGRKYVRVALGGVHDEAEIRGHRRTYLGSMPGRIIAALEKCGTSDPVMVLDEIDKLGADYKGDPSTALLEVLDPEQNCAFHDNYVDQDYDLSNVLFIATANSLSPISGPLLDRMELIEIDGYIEAEKIEIAKRHLIPKVLIEHGFNTDEVSFSDDAILKIIDSYTRESGVRRLEKRLREVMRKLARAKAENRDFPTLIETDNISEYLGKPTVFNDTYENNDIPGIVTGLAWTQAGGEILFIESSVAPGKEGKLTLTGNLGDVMKESAVLALQYVKANADAIGIPKENLEFGNVHIHVPEGAVPKDGPSAGITIVTSLASTFSHRKVRSHLAMTGEITLRGKVLPVGGIKEKILAAKRAGIKTIMLSDKNRKDIEEIKSEYLSGLEFKYVNTIAEALDYALLD